MEKIKKEKITLSLPAETKTDLDELAKQYGMKIYCVEEL